MVDLPTTEIIEPEFLDVTVGGEIDVMQDEKSRALVIKKHMITPESLADLLDGWDGDFETHVATWKYMAYQSLCLGHGLKDV